MTYRDVVAAVRDEKCLGLVDPNPGKRAEVGERRVLDAVAELLGDERGAGECANVVEESLLDVA